MTIEELRNTKITVSEIFEAIRAEMCDSYCKYPEQYKSSENDGNWEMMMDGACNECPLNMLGN
jgi:hypothetical protein